MPRTVGTGYWKASSHDAKVLGSGASAAIVCIQGNDCGLCEMDDCWREKGVKLGLAYTYPPLLDNIHSELALYGLRVIDHMSFTCS